MARPKSDETKRFLDKVKIMGAGCHEWQAGLAKGCYGKFHSNGKTITAHRFSYAKFVGEIGDKHVLHKCDNPKCVNPDHLFLGTCVDNVADMDAKGRRGSAATITREFAEKVKMMLADRYSQQYVANALGVSQASVSRIHRNVKKLFKV
jgi:predicted XRE-type DNA-binding protein